MCPEIFFHLHYLQKHNYLLPKSQSMTSLISWPTLWSSSVKPQLPGLSRPALMLQTCGWRAMWEQTVLTQGASSTSKHPSKTSDVCLFFSLQMKFPLSPLFSPQTLCCPKIHYNLGIVTINSNVWSGSIIFLCRSPAQQFMIILIQSGSTLLCLWYFATFPWNRWVYGWLWN